jgi:hypothetical protein
VPKEGVGLLVGESRRVASHLSPRGHPRCPDEKARAVHSCSLMITHSAAQSVIALVPSTYFRVFVFAALGSLTACGSDEHAPPITGAASFPAPMSEEACAVATEGCPCADAGVTATCRAQRQAGSYVVCGPGIRTCNDAGVWGPCFGPIE